MGKPRTWSEEQFRNAVATSTNKSSVLRKLGLGVTGGNFGTLNHYVAKWELNTDHFDPYMAQRGVSFGPKKPLSSILVEDSSYPSWHLKNRLLEERILENRCSGCGISTWRGKPLSLHLDHVNGRCRDHRIENLRLLCPNCHSQTETYCGKALRKPAPKCKTCGGSISRRAIRCKACANKRTLHPRCLGCGTSISKGSQRCRPCAAALRLGTCTKIKWPQLSELERMVRETSVRSVGEVLGVSDSAVHKHLEKRCGAGGS